MKRIRTSNRAIDLFGAGKDGFKAAVAGVSNATQLDAYTFNHVQEALVRIRESAGVAVPADDDFSWFPTAIQKLIEARVGDYVPDTGLANAYVIALNPAVAAPAHGMEAKFRVTHANTLASTLDAGGGPKPLVKNDGTATADGDLPLNVLVTATFDGPTNSWLINGLVPSQALTQAAADVRYLTQASAQITAVAGGTADALTAVFSPAITGIGNQKLYVRALSANATTTPTINPGSGVVTIVKGNNLPLAIGDIAGAGHWLEIVLDATLGKAVLLNPATGTLGTASKVGLPFDYPMGNKSPSNGLLMNGAAAPSAVYPALFAFLVSYLSGVTISIAGPAVIGWPAHGLYVNAPVKWATTAALPTGLTVGTTYFVIAAGFGANSFQVSATIGGAAINTSGAQAGVHTAIHAPYGCANDLSTFNVPNVAADNVIVQSAANEGTTTVGQNLSHSHDTSPSGGSASQTQSGPNLSSINQGASSTGYSGGAANLAAGIRMRKYIYFV